MERYEELLLSAWRKNPTLQNELVAFLQSECYIALEKIKAIIADDTLSDSECFMKIERIICILENLGSDGGNRHDYS